MIKLFSGLFRRRPSVGDRVMAIRVDGDGVNYPKDFGHRGTVLSAYRRSHNGNLLVVYWDGFDGGTFVHEKHVRVLKRQN